MTLGQFPPSLARGRANCAQDYAVADVILADIRIAAGAPPATEAAGRPLTYDMISPFGRTAESKSANIRFRCRMYARKLLKVHVVHNRAVDMCGGGTTSWPRVRGVASRGTGLRRTLSHKRTSPHWTSLIVSLGLISKSGLVQRWTTETKKIPQTKTQTKRKF